MSFLGIHLFLCSPVISSSKIASGMEVARAEFPTSGWNWRRSVIIGQPQHGKDTRKGPGKQIGKTMDFDQEIGVALRMMDEGWRCDDTRLRKRLSQMMMIVKLYFLWICPQLANICVDCPVRSLCLWVVVQDDFEDSMDCKLRRNSDTGAHGCESRIAL